MKDSWAGKTAVIAGATAGLGLRLAECLVKSGASHLLIVGRDSERLQRAQTELQSSAGQTTIHLCAADASTTDGVANIAGRVAEVLPGSRVDLLINAIGASDRGLAMELSIERLDELVRVNLHAPLLTTQSIAPLMSPGSVIVNIGSLSSLFAPRFLGGYSIVKHGLRALTQQLRMELAERGIHVMLACPGPIARQDAGSRYNHLTNVESLPAAALKGGGGAKLKGLDPGRLAEDILHAAEQRKLELIRPRQARLLLWLITLWPTLGERVLRSRTA